MIAAMEASEKPEDGSGATERRGHHLRRRTWVLAVSVLLLSFAIGAAVAAAGMRLPTSAAEPPAWRANLGLAISAIGILIAGIGVVQMVRAGMFSSSHLAPVRSLSFRQRRQVGRWIRQGELVPDGSMPAAMATAQTMVRQRKAVPLWVGIALNAVGVSLQTPSPWKLTFMILSAACMAVVLLVSRHEGRQAQDWLDARPQQTTTAVASS